MSVGEKIQTFNSFMGQHKKVVSHIPAAGQSIFDMCNYIRALEIAEKNPGSNCFLATTSLSQSSDTIMSGIEFMHNNRKQRPRQEFGIKHKSRLRMTFTNSSEIYVSPLTFDTLMGMRYQYFSIPHFSLFNDKYQRETIDKILIAAVPDCEILLTCNVSRHGSCFAELLEQGILPENDKDRVFNKLSGKKPPDFITLRNWI